MDLSWDDAKRAWTLTERGLDFADAARIFQGVHFDVADERVAYGEPRILTFGFLDQRMVALVWTPRDGGRRIISLRYANDRERARLEEAFRRMGRP